MRKLRNLWCSHKKYCTTTMSPLRSCTPLSGYPHSLSSYDYERTYFSSTPYTYNNSYRFKKTESETREDILDLRKNPSDLSVDRNCDSDDETAKVMLFDESLHNLSMRQLSRSSNTSNKIWEELAALHRQVNNLGQSLQPIHHAPNAYQAPSTNTTAALRAIPNSSTGPRSDYTGADTPTHAQVGRPSITGFLPDHDNRPASRAMSRQSSIQSIKATLPVHQYSDEIANNKSEESKYPPEQTIQAKKYSAEDYRKYQADHIPVKNQYEPSNGDEVQYDQYQGKNQKAEVNYQTRQADSAEYQQGEQYDKEQSSNDQLQPERAGDSHYEPRENIVYETSNGSQQYEPETANVQYDPSNSATYDQTNINYQNQGYDQQQYGENYDQGQYENYNQYEQQYSDPNAQYDYPAAASDPYQGNQYENSQYQQDIQAYQQADTLLPESEIEKPTPKVEQTDSKRSNSPNDKLKS